MKNTNELTHGLRSLLLRFSRRFWGRSYPVLDVKKWQTVYGRRASHIEAEWTTPEHWAHNNYERTHLPQLCVRASGWKARVMALVLWPKTPWVPYREPAQPTDSDAN